MKDKYIFTKLVFTIGVFCIVLGLLLIDYTLFARDLITDKQFHLENEPGKIINFYLLDIDNCNNKKIEKEIYVRINDSKYGYIEVTMDEFCKWVFEEFGK